MSVHPYSLYSRKSVCLSACLLDSSRKLWTKNYIKWYKINVRNFATPFTFWVFEFSFFYIWASLTENKYNLFIIYVSFLAHISFWVSAFLFVWLSVCLIFSLSPCISLSSYRCFVDSFPCFFYLDLIFLLTTFTLHASATQLLTFLSFYNTFAVL